LIATSSSVAQRWAQIAVTASSSAALAALYAVSAMAWSANASSRRARQNAFLAFEDGSGLFPQPCHLKISRSLRERDAHHGRVVSLGWRHQIRSALRLPSVEFIAENGGGPGVRLEEGDEMTITACLEGRRSLSQGVKGGICAGEPAAEPLPLKLPPCCISIQVSNST
jgi:hypothetical protein